MRICSHCGGDHEGDCPVKEATARILDGYKPRGMTMRRPCPGCGEDGKWHWGPGSTSVICECGGKLTI